MQMKSIRKREYFLFGPIPPPYHGQSVAFSLIVQAFNAREIVLVNTERFSLRVMNTIYSILCTWYYFAFFNFDTVYFTSIRSKLGFVKDCNLLLLGRWSGKRIINHLHGANFHSFFHHSGFLEPLIRYCYDGVDASIVLMPGMEKEYADFPGMEIRVIGNCYESSFDEQDESMFQKKNRILFLSNLMLCKGILEFLDACEILLRNNPEIKIAIAGQFYSDAFMNRRSLADHFYRKYRELKNSFRDRIDYLRVVKGEEKIRLLFESDIFVLPTWHPSEAFPLSIIEAMRTGNAVITTRHNFLPEIVKPENGILVAPQSSEELARAMETLLNDPARLKQIQDYNRNYARKEYNPEKYITAVKSIITGYTHDSIPETNLRAPLKSKLPPPKVVALKTQPSKRG